MSAIVVYCTGVSASWCQICGDCACPEGAREDGRLNDPACPLHCPTSKHGDSQAPSLSQMLELGFDAAEDAGVYSDELRRRVARVDVLPRLRLADLWTSGSVNDPYERTRWWIGGGYRAAWVQLHAGQLYAYVRGLDGEGLSYHDRYGPYSETPGGLSCAMAQADMQLERDRWVLVGGVHPESEVPEVPEVPEVATDGAEPDVIDVGAALTALGMPAPVPPLMVPCDFCGGRGTRFVGGAPAGDCVPCGGTGRLPDGPEGIDLGRERVRQADRQERRERERRALEPGESRPINGSPSTYNTHDWGTINLLTDGDWQRCTQCGVSRRGVQDIQRERWPTRWTYWREGRRLRTAGRCEPSREGT